MIRRFCDICGDEIFSNHTGRVKGDWYKNSTRLDVAVVVSVNGAANAGDVCYRCIFEALRSIEKKRFPGENKN